MKTASRLAAIGLLLVCGSYLGFSLAVGQDVEHNGGDCSDEFDNCGDSIGICFAGVFPDNVNCPDTGKLCVLASSGTQNPISYKVCVRTGNSAQECDNAFDADEVVCANMKYNSCQCADPDPDRCYLSDPNCICDPTDSDGTTTFTSKLTCTDPAA